MFPCTYYREKRDDNVETGIMFVVPDPEGQEAQATDTWRLDDQLGKGASAMIKALQECGESPGDRAGEGAAGGPRPAGGLCPGVSNPPC